MKFKLSARRIASWIAVAALVAAVAALAAGPAAATASKARTLDISYVLKPGSKLGPDGKKHDAFWGQTSFKAAVGERVVVTVLNYDGGSHSFTSPGLGVNAIIAGAKGSTPTKTVFSFVAKKAGHFLWYCAIPCDGGETAHWAMNTRTPGFMAGYVTVS